MPRAIAVILVVVGFLVMLFALLIAIIFQGWPGMALGFVGLGIAVAGMVRMANVARAEKYARLSAKLSLPRTNEPPERDGPVPR
jgi:hypothetical protein